MHARKIQRAPFTVSISEENKIELYCSYQGRFVWFVISPLISLPLHLKHFLPTVVAIYAVLIAISNLMLSSHPHTLISAGGALCRTAVRMRVSMSWKLCPTSHSDNVCCSRLSIFIEAGNFAHQLIVFFADRSQPVNFQLGQSVGLGRTLVYVMCE